MAGRIYLLNGPNLDLLGTREPHLYGHTTLADVETICRAAAEKFGFDLFAGQTNAEHEMIEWLHQARNDAAGVVMNAAAWSHYSAAIYDAIKALSCPLIEVHITNIHARDEEWRAHTLTGKAATGIISGLGVNGYVLAIEHLAFALAQKK